MNSSLTSANANGVGLRTSEAPFAAADGYAADQELEILCEALRNITSGTTKLHESNFDHAALYLEIAAEKLRGLERRRRHTSY